MKTVGILLFDEVEVLDFAGPFEVFSVTRQGEEAPFSVCTIAQERRLIHARNGLQVMPDCDFSQATHLDLLIVPGGYGAEETELHNAELLDFLRRRAEEAELVMSVCTGAFLLAECGLLDGLCATTHWMDAERLERDYPSIRVKHGARFVDEGRILTSGGISAGIDLSLYVVGKLLGKAVAQVTARRMEYDNSSVRAKI